MNRHAIVVGASISGLAAARVLRDLFDHVTVVERDVLPDGSAPRSGTPQARHIHVLLMHGQHLLEGLFPGLQSDLANAGAPEMDWTYDCLWYAYRKWGPRFRSGLTTHFSSRDLLEYSIRRRLIADPKVSFIDACDVTGVTTGPDHRRVTGITYRKRATSDAIGSLDGDLVVDASGRESKLPQWLEGLGYSQPEETMVNSFLGYASRIYRRPDDRRDWKAIFVRGTPPDSSRGGGIFPIEGNQWIANLGASQRDYPPIDEVGFLEFARGLPDPMMYEVLKTAEPVTPIYGYRRTLNRVRHYERIRELPDNLVAVGDAVCAFNPVYGQGMTVGVEGAIALGESIRKSGSDMLGLSGRHFKTLAKTNEIPWALATSVDFLYPETESNAPHKSNRLIDAYSARVAMASMDDPEIHLAFLKVIHLMESPALFFSPRIAFRTLAWSWRNRRNPQVRSQTQHIAAPGATTYD